VSNALIRHGRRLEEREMARIYAAVGLMLGTAIALAQTGTSNTSRENQVGDRGQTRARVWAGRSDQPSRLETLRGLLVDDGCLNRSGANMRRMPEDGKPAPLSPPNTEAVRAGAMAHQVADHRSRQPDDACGVTGQTSSFGLLLGDGRYISFDEGGNTRAAVAVQSSAAGRGMLNGRKSAVKPRVTVTAAVQGGRVTVDSVKVD
jgi:hypothetical protein